jgi:C-terminal processing protease CtpA/Prc
MKALIFFTVFCFFIVYTGCHQTGKNSRNLNLSFEDIENGLPKNWTINHQYPGYSVALDSVNVTSGKYAIAMEFTGDITDYHGFTLQLPHNYEGEKITLSGYIKTENVTDGFAGLWLMIDPDPFWKPYALSFMEHNGITGTNDWKRYEITLDMYPEVDNEIEIGGLLSGKGKMWLDDLKVTIDGKDITKAKRYQPKHFPAKDDNGFGARSDVSFPELTRQKVDDLDLLGRIWGFLKYHHPEIAKGNYNWDYELFRILPVYLSATDCRQRDKVLLKWINQYGRISTGKACQPPSDSAFLKPDLSWMENSNISLKLKDLLQKIYTNRNQGVNYYVKMRPHLGNPIFLNEETHMGNDHLPDAGFRLLSLFRYWNIIHYFFPYKQLTDKNWDSVLSEYIPYFIEATSRVEYELTAALLLEEICDPHAFSWDGWERIESVRGSRQAPVFLKFVENKLMVMETKDTGLRMGDIITHIEGKPVEAIVDSMKRYYTGANEPEKMRRIAQDILRTNQNYIQVTYSSFDGTKRKEINTEQRRNWSHYLYNRKDTVQCYKFIRKDIGYINMKTITKEDIPLIKQEFKYTKGIIIDIRNYPPDVFNMLAPYFVSETTPFSKATRGNPDNPGEFTFSSAYKIPESKESYKGKLVVIVNEETASNAEYTAMAFRAGKQTTIVGSQTGGYEGNVSEIILPGGLKTRISGNGIYYPDGRETQRVGIIPDIEIKPTIKGIREGRDELLEKAIDIIYQK